jgi:hypothetical protein
MNVDVAATKTCRKCGRDANALRAGSYRRDENTWIVFDDADSRGYLCNACDLVFGTPAASWSTSLQRGFRSLDESPIL